MVTSLPSILQSDLGGEDRGGGDVVDPGGEEKLVGQRQDAAEPPCLSKHHQRQE